MRQEYRTTDSFFVEACEPEDAIAIVRDHQRKPSCDTFCIKSIVLQEGASRVLTRSHSAVVRKPQQPIES
jgi:hypothetical protein